MAGRLHTLYAALVILFLLLPLLLAIPLSLTDSPLMLFPPRGITTDWYSAFLTSPTWNGPTFVSLALAAVAATLATTIGGLAAWPLARRKFRGRDTLALFLGAPLVVPAILRRVAALYSGRPVVSRQPDRRVVRATYADVVDRVRRLVVALQSLGVGPGDRVATLAWNHQTHLEAYLAVPSMGAVLHTLNLRLHPDDLAYIVNDAEDRVLILDESLVPLFDSFRSRVNVTHVIVVGPDYERLLEAAEPSAYVEPALDELSAAAMCYTSGTTGRPKGVLYSHRALVLHSFGHGLVDTLGGLLAVDLVAEALKRAHNLVHRVLRRQRAAVHILEDLDAGTRQLLNRHASL